MVISNNKSSSPPSTRHLRKIDVSVVMPCLNEADTLATCIRKAQEALHAHKIDGEIIVADNDSVDNSKIIAEKCGVRVVSVKEKGYGNALMWGIREAKGKFIIMGDADNSYDFLEIPKFVKRLRSGDSLVQGCRLPSGGGIILPNAMPFLHRWWGNPMFSFMVRKWFHAPIHDVYCGFRGFTKTLYDRLNLRCTGMEFATEMVIKASLGNEKISEVPITLHPDGRTSHKPHLKTFRDGWRTFRFFLMYSPRWLFLIPGIVLTLLGLIGYSIALPNMTIAGIHFDAHTLLFASLALLLGYQSMLFALFTKTFAIREGFLPQDKRMETFFQVFNLEKGLLGGGIMTLIGFVLLMMAVTQWWAAGFGSLEYSQTMRVVIPGVTCTALGVQTVLSSFFVSILGMYRK